MTRWGLNISREGESMTSLGSLFQCSATLNLSKLFLKLRWNSLSFSLWPLLFVLSLSTTEKCLGPSSWHPPLRYFYVFMRSRHNLLQTEQAQLPQSLLMKRDTPGPSIVAVASAGLSPVAPYLCCLGSADRDTVAQRRPCRAAPSAAVPGLERPEGGLSRVSGERSRGRAGRGGAAMALRCAAPGRVRWLARALAGSARLLPPAAAAAGPPGPARARLPQLSARFASSAGSGTEGPQRRVMVVRITSPFAWLRTRFYYLLIRLYFDQEFSIEEFTRGAKQAFSVVSKLLSQRKLDLLEELVSAEVLQVLKEKISLLPDSHRDALAADIDAIMYTTEGDVRIYYDDDGRKFVSILMCFWYLNGANLPDEVPGEAKVFQIVFGDENTKEKKHLLTANYEFQREFTEGAKPDWTITRIEHPRLLE